MKRLHLADVVRLLVTWVLSTLALAITAWLLPGFSIDTWYAAFAAAAVTGVAGLLVRPLLITVTAAIGWVALALGAVVGQAVVMQIALSQLSHVHLASFGTAVAAAWIAAILGTILVWLSSAGTTEAFDAKLQAISKPGSVEDDHVDGVVFIQCDGVAYPVMNWALSSGTMPTLRRWIDEGSHTLHEWLVQMPCTTPASQQAILHGHAEGVPAFRWYDRELGRVLVANRPADAAIIEARASDGLGLLADGGISVSNLFSGDAERSAMTMSHLREVSRGQRQTREAFGRFLLRPDGFARSIARTFAEVSRERFQAKRQRKLDIRPRVARSWTFAGLRAATNGLLRDVNSAIVAQEMARGTRSIYVNYVDYDEIAHHAGFNRIEALACLTGVDQAIAGLAKVAARAPRTYHFVLLSDHGQSQGASFEDRWGIDLAGLCAQLSSADVTAVEDSVEGWGRVGALAYDLSGSGGPARGVAKSVTDRVEEHTDAGTDARGEDFVVLGSGNLGLVYVPGKERLLRSDLDARWPTLVSGLAHHPGIGFVAVMTETGPVAFGTGGSHHLVTHEVTGTDPLEPFGDHAPEFLRRAALMKEAPDIYVNSAVDPGTDEIAAFEHLVGAHGGLGGPQDRAFLLAPTAVLNPEGPIRGGDELHRLLVSALEAAGQRRHLQPAGTDVPTSEGDLPR